MSPVTKKLVDLKAKIICGDKSYPCSIKNLSEDNIYLLTALNYPHVGSAQGSSLILKLADFEGKTMNLRCKVKCSYKTPPHGMSNSMIIKVTDPSVKYKALLSTL